MNLLVGCRAKVEGDREGTIIDILHEAGKSWGHADVLVLLPSGYIVDTCIGRIDIFKEDLNFIQQIGKTEKQREKLLKNVHSRFDLMDLRK